MTFFAHQSAAERYAAARPYFHPIVIEIIKARLGPAAPVGRALDVACGTGQSAVALQGIAREIIGADRSRAMLVVAPREPGLRYVEAAAEALPFAAATFDLVTVALAFHWFDRTRFLAEVRRALRPGGWLAIYNNGFSGTMRENPTFERWSREVYLARYPTPPRHQQPLTDAEAMAAGFSVVTREHYTNDVVFTAPALAAYLMTQSNIIAALEEGAEDGDAIRAWLLTELAPLFPSERATFPFGGPIWLLQTG
jgi:SAM-dependent methyltransferase